MLKTVQLKYAMERINSIAREKQAAIHEDAAKVDSLRLSSKQFMALVRRGQIKVKGDAVVTLDKWGGSSGIRDMFDLSGVADWDAQRAKAEASEKEKHKRNKALESEVRRIKDQLILGDSQAALAAIETFSKLKF